MVTAQSTAAKRLSKARVSLLLDSPFFGSLAMRLRMVPDVTVDTMATDGQSIYYSEKFVANLSDAELQGVLAHETMHCAGGHIWRRGSRELRKWNVATDYAINQLLVNSGFQLPSSALLDTRWHDTAPEVIYGMLPDTPQQGSSGAQTSGGTDRQRVDGDNNAPDPGGCGAVLDAPGDCAHTEADWKTAVAQARVQARGNMPAGLDRWAEEVVKPTLPWRALLREFVERSAKNDYLWSRPNRRWLQSGIVLPTLQSDEIPQLVVAFDTSGSISRKLLDEFIAELRTIAASFQTTIEVLWCDVKVHRHETWETAVSDWEARPVGGGGTDFRPVFAWVEQHGWTPSCLVYLSDLAGRFPDAAPEYPTLWCAPAGSVHDPPFGEHLRID